MRLLSASLAFAAAVCSADVAAAQSFPAPEHDVVLSVGGGLAYGPDWDGSRKMMLSPMPIFGVKFLRSPFTGKPTADTGFGIAPSFRYLSKRTFDATSIYSALPEVPEAFEAGITVDYTDTNFRAFATVRQGFGGHHGQIAELGLDGIVRPFDHLTISAGPRVSFASTDYMRTYWGVSPEVSALTGFPEYDPGGGYRGAGLGGSIVWDIDRNWFVEADASWTRLGDVYARLPVAQTDGSADQIIVGIGVGRRFSLDLW